MLENVKARGVIGSTLADDLSGMYLSQVGNDMVAFSSIERLTQWLQSQDSNSLNQITWALADPDFASILLATLPNLKWVQSTWAGIEKFLLNERRDYQLTSLKGVFGPLMAEYVLGHILSFNRRINQYHLQTQDQNWCSQKSERVLSGQTILLLGYGSTAQKVGEICAMFDAKIYGLVRSLAKDRNKVSQHITLIEAGRLSEILPEVDHVVSFLPNTPQTHKLVDSDFLAQCKRSALIISVGRGAVIDEDALICALNNQMIAGAVLDVCAVEPLPKGDPLWSAKNILLTSHSAAPTLALSLMGYFLKNKKSFDSGQPMEGVVNFNLGY